MSATAPSAISMRTLRPRRAAGETVDRRSMSLRTIVRRPWPFVLRPSSFVRPCPQERGDPAHVDRADDHQRDIGRYLESQQLAIRRAHDLADVDRVYDEVVRAGYSEHPHAGDSQAGEAWHRPAQEHSALFARQPGHSERGEERQAHVNNPAHPCARRYQVQPVADDGDGAGSCPRSPIRWRPPRGCPAPRPGRGARRPPVISPTPRRCRVSLPARRRTSSRPAPRWPAP